jgi:hypothetical protein
LHKKIREQAVEHIKVTDKTTLAGTFKIKTIYKLGAFSNVEVMCVEVAVKIGRAFELVKWK